MLQTSKLSHRKWGQIGIHWCHVGEFVYPKANWLYMPYKIALESGTHPAKSLNLLHQIVYSPSRLHTGPNAKQPAFNYPTWMATLKVSWWSNISISICHTFLWKLPYLYSSIRVYAYIYSEFIQEVMLLVDLSRTFRLFLTRLRWPCLQEP